MIELIFAIILFLISLRIAFKSSYQASLLFLLSLPLNNRILFELPHPQLVPPRIVLVAIITASCFKFLKIFKQNGIKPLKEIIGFISQDFFSKILWSLTLVRAISIIFSRNLEASISLLFFHLSINFLYHFLKNLQNKSTVENLSHKLLNTYILGVSLSGFFTYIQIIAYLPFFDRKLPGVWPSDNAPTRYGGLFWDINHFGPYIFSVLPILFMRVLSAKSFKTTTVNSLLLIHNFFVLAVTLSRTAWVGSAFTFIILSMLVFILKFKKVYKKFISLAFISVVVSIMIIWIFNIPVIDRLYTLTGNVYNDSQQAHDLIFKANFEIWSKNPVFGGGLGSFNEQFRNSSFIREYLRLDPVGQVRIPAHSLWLEPLSESGTIGFFLVFTLLSIILFSLYKSAKIDGDNKQGYEKAAVFSSLTGFFISGLYYSYNLEYFFAFIFLAIIISKNFRISKDFQFNYFVISFIILGGSIFYLNKLGSSAFIDWDEPIYAKISKNILQYNDFTTLRWKYLSHWFEKPPLYMYLTSFFYSLFEESEFTARIVSALSGVFLLIASYLGFLKLYKNKLFSILNASILISTIHITLQARNGTLDVLLTLVLFLSVLFFLLALKDKKYLKFSFIFLALTTLTKGVVVIMPILIISLIFMLSKLRKEEINFKLRDCWIPLTLFFIITVPWHLKMTMLYGKEFWDSYIGYQVLQRASMENFENHGKPFLWFLEVLITWFRQNNYLLFFGVLLLIIRNRFFILNKKIFEKIKNISTLDLSIIASCLVIFFVLSTSKGKIQWYILPIYPFLSILVTRLFMIADFKIINRLIIPLTLTLGIIYHYKDPQMWQLDDVNADVRATVRNADVYSREDPRMPLYISDSVPLAPALFYASQPAKQVTSNVIKDLIENEKPFIALGKKGKSLELIDLAPNEDVVIYTMTDDYILYGRKAK